MRHPRLRSSFVALALVSVGAVAVYACGGDEVTPPGDDGAGDRAETSTTSGDGPDVADSSSDVNTNPDASLLSPTFVYRDINQVLATGQSLSVGALGTPTLSITQPYANTMFVTGVMTDNSSLSAFVPLVEGTVETMSSAFASLVTKLAREVVLVGQPTGRTSHDLLISGHGIGGTAYVGLKKGTAAFTNGIAQVQAAHNLAVQAKRTHVVRAVTNVHGESDSISNNVAYEANLLEWQANYETDVKAITGQAEPIPMLHSQFSSWTRLGGTGTTSIIPSAQLAAHVNAPGKIVLVGAKYHLPYVADGVHLTNEGYRHMGEEYAKVYRRVILEGKAWEPVRPKTVTRAGAVLTVKMHVPVPPLVLDTTIVTNPGNFGFEWVDGGPTPVTIAAVTVASADTVVITLSAVPTGPTPRLRYAYTGVSGALGGPTTGPRGNLRDSDATPSRNGYALYNWCIHFDVPAL